MVKDEVKDKANRYKIKAAIFFERKTKAFIKTYSDDYYFCQIISIHEYYIRVYNFAGKRKGEKDKIYFIDMDEFNEYKKEGENNEEI